MTFSTPKPTDLPPGHRWATEAECEAFAMGQRRDLVVILRTADSNGVPYIEGEADLAVPDPLTTFAALWAAALKEKS